MRLALGVNLGFIDLEAGERLGLALARRNDVNAITALLVGDCHRTNGAAKLCRFLDGCIDLGLCADQGQRRSEPSSLSDLTHYRDIGYNYQTGFDSRSGFCDEQLSPN